MTRRKYNPKDYQVIWQNENMGSQMKDAASRRKDNIVEELIAQNLIKYDSEGKGRTQRERSYYTA